jgi:hypothetical protein
MMFLAFQAAEKVAGFPRMNQDLRVFGLITNCPGQTTVIFMGVREDDSPEIRKLFAMPRQSVAQGFYGFGRFRAGVDQRQRLVVDQINIDVTDQKRSWQSYRNNFHKIQAKNRLHALKKKMQNPLREAIIKE